MHLLVRETRTLDEAEAANDLRQSPGDIVVLSFSDSDLGALAAAWQAMDEPKPSLRLANLARLRHPMSVDLYVEDVLAHARCVFVRLLGGVDYWRYGAEEVAAACRAQEIALAMIPGDGRADERLAALSTLSPPLRDRLDRLMAQGGPANMGRALRLAAHVAHAGGLAPDDGLAAEAVPSHGVHAVGFPERAGERLAVIVFYRSYLLAGDMAPVQALAAALDARGLAVRALFVASLKEPESAAFTAQTLRTWKPTVVLNATGFAARQGEGGSPLDAADAPVLQIVLAGSTRDTWAASSRGLTPADLAMQVVMPELDGRLLTAAASFKHEEPAVAGLNFARSVHRPDPGGIGIAADRAAGWARLAGTSAAKRRVALLLSDYPNAGGQVGHAVGLDTFASAQQILTLLQRAGYDTRSSDDLVAALTQDPPTPLLSLTDYRRLFASLPPAARQRIVSCWGEPDADAALSEGWFTLRHLVLGRVVVAIEPARGSLSQRKATYHDPDLPPCHGYVAFRLWLRHLTGAHVLVHLGAHGSLEWLPG
ncbi:MAG: cobaltochelatase subunit CobN, partial [Pseudomonadota bacterium]|nr:cobaltochelatase subunit CobN [Pseudomonadota bacterium]